MITNNSVPSLDILRNPEGVSTHTGPYALTFSEISSKLFDSLPRSDQRRKGMEYVRGLLGTRGKKSVRNIAAQNGGQVSEQGLHHFVNSSTWDWNTVRQALSQYLAYHMNIQAWVVRPMVIPKAGLHSVGVEKSACPKPGQARNMQQSVGVWAASEEISSPVDWRLHLPQKWLNDRKRRNKVSIPEGFHPESFGDCAIEAYLGMRARQDLPVLPVVLDAREMDVSTIFRKFRAAGVPVLARVTGSLELGVAAPAPAGHSAETLSARRIMERARDRRYPTRLMGSGPMATVRMGTAATVRVRVPRWSREAAHLVPGGELLLVGMSENGQDWPGELWLTNLTAVEPAALLRMSRLIHRVDRDFTAISSEVGIRDFGGRSFGGWHRHVTLASVAHAVVALTTRESTDESPTGQPHVV